MKNKSSNKILLVIVLVIIAALAGAGLTAFIITAPERKARKYEVTTEAEPPEEAVPEEDESADLTDFRNQLKSMSEDEKVTKIFPNNQLDDFFETIVGHKNKKAVALPDRSITGEVVPYDGVERSISCWGDSMTDGVGTDRASITVDGEEKSINYATFPSVLEDLTGIITYNLGVGGETSEQIAMRQGGIPIVTDRDIVIPEIGGESFCLVSEYTGDLVDFNDYSGYGFKLEDYANRVMVDDGLFKIVLNDSMHMIYQKLSRNGPSIARVDGDGDVMIPEGTRIYTLASVERKDDILIIEMGSNGGWDDDYSELVAQYDAMLEYANCDYYIILGDTDDPPTSVGLGDDVWEATLRKAFGDHFINMRTYLMQNGLTDNGLETTYADLENYINGKISTQLRSDWTHLNAYGYYSKGLAVYEKGVELGYWE